MNLKFKGDERLFVFVKFQIDGFTLLSPHLMLAFLAAMFLP